MESTELSESPNIQEELNPTDLDDIEPPFMHLNPSRVT